MTNTDGVPENIPPVDPGYGDSGLTEEQGGPASSGTLSPGSTATGAGEAELGTTEADVSDGSEQKLPPVDSPA
jgi:hypothetical protein